MIQSCGRARPSNKPLYYELATCCKISSDNEIVDIFLPKNFAGFLSCALRIFAVKGILSFLTSALKQFAALGLGQNGGIAPDLEVFFEAESVFVKEST